MCCCAVCGSVLIHPVNVLLCCMWLGTYTSRQCVVVLYVARYLYIPSMSCCAVCGLVLIHPVNVLLCYGQFFVLLSIKFAYVLCPYAILLFVVDIFVCFYSD